MDMGMGLASRNSRVTEGPLTDQFRSQGQSKANSSFKNIESVPESYSNKGIYSTPGKNDFAQGKTD
jgi:hypothetical protein